MMTVDDASDRHATLCESIRSIDLTLLTPNMRELLIGRIDEIDLLESAHPNLHNKNSTTHQSISLHDDSITPYRANWMWRIPTHRYVANIKTVYTEKLPTLTDLDLTMIPDGVVVELVYHKGSLQLAYIAGPTHAQPITRRITYVADIPHNLPDMRDIYVVGVITASPGDVEQVRGRYDRRGIRHYPSDRLMITDILTYISC